MSWKATSSKQTVPLSINNNNCAKIRIYSVEGKTIELVKQFTLKKRWVEELYLENSKLIILSSDSIEDNSNATCGVADDCITLNETTYIDIYDVSTPQNAKKIKKSFDIHKKMA